MESAVAEDAESLSSSLPSSSTMYGGTIFFAHSRRGSRFPLVLLALTQ